MKKIVLILALGALLISIGEVTPRVKQGTEQIAAVTTVPHVLL